MRQFEDYVLESFDHTTGWYQDNSYESLNRTADRTTPRIRMSHAWTSVDTLLTLNVHLWL